jgi:DNA polymerase-1
VETAGLTGFLDNLKVWRSESDFDTQYWEGHLGWLRGEFGDSLFRTAQVRERALGDPGGYLAPPKLDDPGDKGYGKALGEAYSRLRGRRYGKLWVERSGTAHGHVSVWQVFQEDQDPPTEENPTREPTPPPVVPDPEPVDMPVSIEPAPENEHAEARGPAPEDTDGEGHDEVRGPAAIVHGQAPGMLGEMERALAAEGLDTNGDPIQADVVTFDLETGDADELHKADPDTYIRLAGATREDRPVVTRAGLEAAPFAAAAVRLGATVTGHNIMAFDLPALVRRGVLTMTEVHQLAADGRLFDALLAARFIDPPMARDKGVDMQRKYDLGTLARTYELNGDKLTDTTTALKKKYGGWNEIPWDTEDPDPERAADAELYRTYMVQDVELSRELHQVLLAKVGGEVPDYLRREHRVAAIAAQISANGFLVNQPLLAERVTEVNERKAGSVAWLHDNIGLPLADAKGKPYKSPLASKVGKEALEAALRLAGVTSLWRTGRSQDLDTSGDHMKHLAQEYAHLPAVRQIALEVYRIVGARSVYQTISDHVAQDGRVHPKIGFEQATGRWSVTSPGLTVLGKRGGRHVERAVLLPDPGEVLISVDLSQVDMRAVAGLSQDQAYIEMLKREDPHKELAVALFGDAGFRETAKAIGHGWNYGESLKRISMENEIDPAIVRRFDTSMYERFGRMVEWREEVRALAGSGALLDNGFGRLMRPDPQRAHTQGPALMGQGAARDLMMTGLLRLPAEVLPMLRAQIHDEVVLSVPEKHAAEISRVVVDAFTFEWRGVPILSDVSRTGTDWSKCYEK